MEPGAVLGVLGGMGPLATVDFIEMVIAHTPAKTDQEHLPMLVYSVPQIPDRTDAILGIGADPLPAMLLGIDFLNRNGAGVIAVACNTAHHWFSHLERASVCPILHIADAAVSKVASIGITAGNVGLLATSGTVTSGFYQRRLAQHGLTCQLPSDQDAVMHAVRLVKQNEIDGAAGVLHSVADALVAQGCGYIVLGCTEIPIALRQYGDGRRLIDATAALAQRCVEAVLATHPRR